MTREQDRRPAFTLMELLIVSVLISAMMAGIWTLLRSWTRISERGEARTERAQLVRSLSDQFRDDVQALAFRPPPPGARNRSSRSSARASTSTSSTSSPESAFNAPSSFDASPSAGTSFSSSSSSSGSSENQEPVLVGGSDWLVLDLLQPPNPYNLPPASEDDFVVEEEQQNVVRAPELQRVIYSFRPPEDDEDLLLEEAAFGDDMEMETIEDGPEFVYGLVRLELARERYGGLLAANSTDPTTVQSPSSMREAVFQMRELVTGGGDAQSAGGSAGGVLGLMDEETTALIEKIRTDEIPEVRTLEFSYYDGSAWRSSWNSLNQQGLPVAIELRFELEEVDADDEPPMGGDDTERVEDELGLNDMDASWESELAESEPPLLQDDLTAADDLLVIEPYERVLVYLGPARE